MKLFIDVTFNKNKKFGITISAVLCVLSVWHYFKNHHLYIYYISAALVILLISYVFPEKLTLPRKIWEKIGQILGQINTYILLTIIFFLLLFPLSLLMKLYNKDFIGRKLHPEMNSYWEKKSFSGNNKMQF